MELFVQIANTHFTWAKFWNIINIGIFLLISDNYYVLRRLSADGKLLRNPE